LGEQGKWVKIPRGPATVSEAAVYRNAFDVPWLLRESGNLPRGSCPFDRRVRRRKETPMVPFSGTHAAR